MRDKAKATPIDELDARSGTVTTATSTTLQDRSKSWDTDEWKTFELAIPGQSRIVTSNDHDTLSIGTGWDEEPVPGTPYRLRRRV